jgi:hypothetical protein
MSKSQKPAQPGSILNPHHAEKPGPKVPAATGGGSSIKPAPKPAAIPSGLPTAHPGK